MTSNPPSLPRLSSFLRPPASAASPPQAPQAAAASPPALAVVRPMRPRSLTQTLYDQTQQRFANLQAAPLDSHTQQQLQLQQRSRKRKSSSTNSSSNSAFQLPLRSLQASSAGSAPFSVVYDSTQLRSLHEQQSSGSPARSPSQAAAVTAADDSHSASVPPPQQPQPQQRERTSRYLSEGDRRTIISRIERGEKQVTLAKEYSVSRAAICNLYKNRKEVLTRVDRDPEAKHPKKQKPKKSPTAAADAAGVESPQPLAAGSPSAAAASAMSLSSSPSEEEEDGQVERNEDDLEEKSVLKAESDAPVYHQQQQQPQEHQRAFGHPATTATAIVRTERTLTTEDFSGPMETVLLPRASSFSSATSAAAPSARAPRSPSASLDRHRRVKPFLVHEASVYSLPIKKLLSSLRDVETRGAAFRHQTDRAMRLLVEEALACLPQRETDILTPYGDAIPGFVPTDERAGVCAISMEAGQSMLLRTFADVQPLSPTGVLTLATVAAADSPRDREGRGAAEWQIHAQLPPLHRGQAVLLLDLLCSTGERACSALSYLVHEARVPAASVYFVTVNASIPGLQRVHHYFPDVSLITAQMDKVVDDQRRIRPGVGDFLERYWNPSYHPEHRPRAAMDRMYHPRMHHQLHHR